MNVDTFTYNASRLSLQLESGICLCFLLVACPVIWLPLFIFLLYYFPSTNQYVSFEATVLFTLDKSFGLCHQNNYFDPEHLKWYKKNCTWKLFHLQHLFKFFRRIRRRLKKFQFWNLRDLVAKTKFEVKTTAARNVEPESAVSRNVNVILNDKKIRSYIM